MSDQPATFGLTWLGIGLRCVLRENGDRDGARILDMKAASARGGFGVASLDRFDDIAEFGEAGCKTTWLCQGRRPQHRDAPVDKAQHFAQTRIVRSRGQCRVEFGFYG